MPADPSRPRESAPAVPLAPGAADRRLRRVFLEGFRAIDVAEPLVSFDAERASTAVRDAMRLRGFDPAGFLFGMITLLEMLVVRQVEAAFPADAWTVHVAPGRLAKARELMAERQRRGLACRLVDCLQFSDKGQLALRIGDLAARLAPNMSGKEAKRALQELEHLRNDLAHGQEIVATSWERIVRFSRRLDELLESI